MVNKTVNLRELSMIEKEIINSWGQRENVITLDRSRLLRLQKLYAAYGREHFSEFKGWMLLDLGFLEDTADAVVGRVWDAIYEYGGDAMHKLEDEGLSWSYRQKIHTDLRKLAAYCVHAGAEDDLELGEKLVVALAESPFWYGRPKSTIIDKYRPRSRDRRRRG